MVRSKVLTLDLSLPSFSYFAEHWASVITKLCRGQEKLGPCMLSPGLLVAYLWEKSNSRACEGVLPPLGPSPLKPMSMDAQCVGAGLRASQRQPRRLSPSRSVDSNAESGIATFCFPNKTWQMGLFFQRTDSVWTGGCDEGLWRRGTGPSIFSRAWFLVALLCKVKKSKEANGHVSCCLH